MKFIAATLLTLIAASVLAGMWYAIIHFVIKFW